MPSYRSSLESERAAARSSARCARPRSRTIPRRPYLKQQFTEAWAPKVNARIVVFDLQNTVPALLEPVADSASETRLERRRERPRRLRGDPGADARTRAPSRAAARRTPRSPIRSAARSCCSRRRCTTSCRSSPSCAAGSSSPARSAMVFAVLLGYAGASVFARRIRRLEYAADRIAAGSFDEPVVDHGSDEVGQLARSFERMRLRLAHLDRARGEFIANASHELRTPLFSLGGFLELLDDPGLDEAHARRVPRADARAGRPPGEAGDRPARPLPARRRPAGGRDRADRPRRARRRPGARSSAPARRPSRIRSTWPARTESWRSATPSARRQIGRILVENALVHTPPGTTVRVSSALDGSRATLTVANDGPGHPARRPAADLRALLPARRRPRLGQRPRSGDRARAGRGDGRPDRARLPERLDAVHARALSGRR